MCYRFGLTVAYTEMEPFRGGACYWEELSLQTFPWKRYRRRPLPVSVFLTVRINRVLPHQYPAMML